MDLNPESLAASRLARRLRRCLEHAWLPVVLAAAGMLSTTPALSLGWVWDDLVHRAWLLPPTWLEASIRESSLLPSSSGELGTVLMHLYSYVGPDRSAAGLIDLGLLPWWTSPQISLSFWRPIAAFTHWLDYQLWPDSAPLMHLHSILLYGLVIFVIAIAYRRLLRPAWIAGLAALLFTLDESHYIPVAWIASRNLLLSLLFGALTLLAYDRWRRRDERIMRFIAVALFGVTLLTGEVGVSTFAYLGAYALFLDRGRWTERFLRLTPFMVVLAAWVWLYQSLGYGTFYTPIYASPIREPLRFAAGALENAPILLLGQWGWPPAQIYSYLSEPVQRMLWVVAASSAGFALFMLRPLILRNRVAAFLILGMLLSLVPPSGADSPNERRLLFVGFGAMGLIAQFLGGMAAGHRWVPQGSIWRSSAAVFSVLLLIIHLVVAGAGRVLAPGLTRLANDLAQPMLRIEAGAELREQDLVIVSAPSSFLVSFFPFQRAEQGTPIPRHIRILAPSFVPLEITRTGENALSVATEAESLLPSEPPTGWILPHPTVTLVRSEMDFHPQDFANSAGRELELTGFRLRVTEFGRGGYPKTVSYEFAVPLEDPSLKWVAWDWQTWSYRSFNPPPVGGYVRLAGAFDPQQTFPVSISSVLRREFP